MDNHNSFVSVTNPIGEDGSRSASSEFIRIAKEANFQKQVMQVPMSVMWSWMCQCLSESGPEFRYCMSNRT